MSFAAAPKLYAMEYYYTLERGTNLSSHPIHVSKKTEALGFGSTALEATASQLVPEASRGATKKLTHYALPLSPKPVSTSPVLSLPPPSLSPKPASSAIFFLSLSCPWLLAPSRLSPPPLSARSSLSTSLSPTPRPPPYLFVTAGARRPPAALGAAASDTGSGKRVRQPLLSPFHSFALALLICWFHISPIFSMAGRGFRVLGFVLSLKARYEFDILLC
jgi:hypothetical protein